MRNSHTAARMLKASAFALIAAAALAQLCACAPSARFAPATLAQKPDEQKKLDELKKLPTQTPLPQQRRPPALVADPKLINLCPGESASVRLSTRPPARGSWYPADGVGEIAKVDAEEGTAVWDLSGAKPGTYAAAFKSAAAMTHAPAPRRVRVTIRECAKPTPTPTPTPKPTPTQTPIQTPTPTITPPPTATPTPRGNDNSVLGGFTPTPSSTTPSPTPSPSASPTPTPGETPLGTSGASTPEVSASPAPDGDGNTHSWFYYAAIAAIALAVFAVLGLLRGGGPGLLLNINYSAVLAAATRTFRERALDIVKASLGTAAEDAPSATEASMDIADGEATAEAVPASEQTNEIKGESDEVQCAVFSPLKVSPGDSFLVQVFAYLASQASQVSAMATGADADAKLRDSAELDEKIERGQELVFELTMRGLEVQEPTTMRLVWKGKPKSIKFDVSVPEDCQPKSVTGTVDIYYLNVPIGNLRFKLDIVPRAHASAEPERTLYPEQQFKRYRYAFISYASEDRAEVLRRVQVLPLVSIDYFQDITSLDPGDRWAKKLYTEIDKSDVFFLFWSKAARDSEWVGREVLYAIERKHGDEDAAPAIKPVMLEGPPPVKPPEKLRSLHFNDKLLYFISVEDSLRAARGEDKDE